MSKLRISIVEYLNTAPLVWGFTDGPLAGKYDLSFTWPSQCAEALRSGTADVAIIPSIEYQRMENVVALPVICKVAAALKTSAPPEFGFPRSPTNDTASVPVLTVVPPA